MSSKGINNWREGFWIAILGIWMFIHVGVGLGFFNFSVGKLLIGTQVLVVGISFHVVWVNIISPQIRGA